MRVIAVVSVLIGVYRCVFVGQDQPQRTRRPGRFLNLGHDVLPSLAVLHGFHHIGIAGTGRNGDHVGSTISPLYPYRSADFHVSDGGNERDQCLHIGERFLHADKTRLCVRGRCDGHLLALHAGGNALRYPRFVVPVPERVGKFQHIGFVVVVFRHYCLPHRQNKTVTP